MGSFFSHVDLFHPADHRVICLRTRSGIEILSTVVVPQSTDTVGCLYIQWVLHHKSEFETVQYLTCAQKLSGSQFSLLHKIRN